jgi:primosomal protein N'
MMPMRYRVRSYTEPDASEWTEDYEVAARWCLNRRKSEQYAGHTTLVEVEVLDLEQEALQAKKDAVANCLEQMQSAKTPSEADLIIEEAWEEYRKKLRIKEEKDRVIDWSTVFNGCTVMEDTLLKNCRHLK